MKDPFLSKVLKLISLNISLSYKSKAGYYFLKKVFLQIKDVSLKNLFLKETINLINSLIISQYGSLLIQVLIKNISMESLVSLISSFKGRLYEIGVSKHSGRILEMFLVKGGKYFFKQFEEEIIKSNKLTNILLSPSGIYIFRRIIDIVADITQLSQMKSLIKSNFVNISAEIQEKFKLLLKTIESKIQECTPSKSMKPIKSKNMNLNNENMNEFEAKKAQSFNYFYPAYYTQTPSILPLGLTHHHFYQQKRIIPVSLAEQI